MRGDDPRGAKRQDRNAQAKAQNAAHDAGGFARAGVIVSDANGGVLIRQRLSPCFPVTGSSTDGRGPKNDCNQGN